MKNKCSVIFCLILILPAAQGMQNPWLEQIVIPLWIHLLQNNAYAPQQIDAAIQYQNPPQKQLRIKRTQQPRTKKQGRRIHQP